MSLTELQITVEKDDVSITVEPLPLVNVKVETIPNYQVILAGNIGPPGPPGKWEALTQSEYDLLTPPDPDTLYVIIQ